MIATSKAKLGDLGAIVTGTTPPASEPGWFATDGTPFLTPSDIPADTRYVTTARYLSSEGSAANARRLVPADAICFVSIGSTIGKMCTTTTSTLTNQQINSLLVDTAVGDPTFVYYALRSRVDEVRSIAGGSATPIVNKSTFTNLVIDVLPVDYQRVVGGFLDGIDDKIESNRRLVLLTLELIRAKVNQELSLDLTSVPVSTLAEFVNGGAYTKGASGYGRMVIRIAELNSGPGRSTIYNDIEIPDDKTAQPGDILMSWSGSLGVYRWARDEAIINQHIFKVIPAAYPAWLVFDRLEAVIEIFRDIAKDKATTMGHIKRGHLDSTPVQIPSQDSIVLLDAELGALWSRLLLAERECQTLESLRNALLPELLSGRIRVSEATQVAQDVLEESEGA